MSVSFLVIYAAANPQNFWQGFAVIGLMVLGGVQLVLLGALIYFSIYIWS